jgi:hypothetical protein
MAAGLTYEPIATATASGSQATISFTSISGSYTDLVLVTQTSYGANGKSINMQFNSDTGANYSYTFLLGDGSAASSGRGTAITGVPFAFIATAGQVDVSIVSIQNYSNSTTYKTCLYRSNNAANRVQANVALWRSTSAITRIDVKSNDGTNYSSGSTFTLYGIAAA